MKNALSQNLYCFRATVILTIVGLFLLAGCGNVPRYERSGDRGPLGRIMFGNNASERQMADGIYQLTVRDSRDKHEISPMDMMLFFAAELTKENGYETFIMLPHDERPYKPAEIKKLRQRVLSREFDDFMKNLNIRVKTTQRCTNGVCSTMYKSKAIIVMLKGEERKKARSYNANKVYEKLKSRLPLREKRQI